MKPLYWLCLLGSLTFNAHAQGQQCLPVSAYRLEACIQSPSLEKSYLHSARHGKTNSLERFFYDYFEGTDYEAYKNLFLKPDWYGLPEDEFIAWRSFTKNASLKLIGTLEADVNGKRLGVIKYTYTTDEKLLYETLLAKKSGSQWVPLSTKEERAFFDLSRMIKNIKLDYLASFFGSGKSPSTSALGQQKAMAELLNAKDSLRVFAPDEFALYFNPDEEYISDKKYREDRTHDPEFISFLQLMQLSAEQVTIVMKYIQAFNYLQAAQKADEFSPATYTYAPFVDQIRQTYGKDRIKKWNQTTQNWE